MKRVKYVLPILILVNLLCMMDVSIMTIVLPEIQTTFGESLTNLSWALNVYTIVFASLIIPFGRLSDKLGKNKFIFTGLIIFAIGSFLTGNSANLTYMLISRGIQSVGAAMIIPTTMVTAMELTDDNSRNKTVGILAGSQGLAVALGPTFGGLISQYLGWRWVFFVNVPIVIIVLLIFNIVLPLKNENTKKNITLDWLGTILSIILLSSFSLALVQGKNWGWNSAKIIFLLITSLISFVAFIIIESKVSNPMINLKLFKYRNFTGSAISLVLCNYFLGGFVILIPTFLTKIYDYNELTAALLITPYSISVMFSVVLTSLAIKKINKKLVIGLGFILVFCSYYMLSRLNLNNNSLPLIYAGIVLGVGYGMIASTANILAASNFHGSLLTDSNSVANVLRQVGMVLSIAVFSSILANNITNAKNNLITYGNTEVNQLNIPNEAKRKINKKINDKLSPNNTKISSNNSLHNPNIKIPNKKINSIKFNAYNSTLNKVNLATGSNNVTLPKPIKDKIDININNAINKKEKQINISIAKFLKIFKKQIKNKLKNSFLNVYKTMMLLPIFSLIIIPIFKFKKEINHD